MLLSRLIDHYLQRSCTVRTAPRSKDLGTHGHTVAQNALDNVKVHPASQTTAPKRTDEPSIHDVIEPPTPYEGDDELVFLLRAQENLVEPDGIEPTT